MELSCYLHSFVHCFAFFEIQIFECCFAITQEPTLHAGLPSQQPPVHQVIDRTVNNEQLKEEPMTDISNTNPPPSVTTA